MNHKIEKFRRDVGGRIAVPMLMWFAGVPLGLVLVIWLIFFRG